MFQQNVERILAEEMDSGLRRLEMELKSPHNAAAIAIRSADPTAYRNAVLQPLSSILQQIRRRVQQAASGRGTSSEAAVGAAATSSGASVSATSSMTEDLNRLRLEVSGVGKSEYVNLCI